MNNTTTPDNKSQDQVEIGEALFAVLGLTMFLDKKIEKVRVTQFADALAMNRTVTKMARQVVEDTERMELPDCKIAYRVLLDRFSEGIDQPALEETANSIHDAKASLGLMGAVTRVFQFLSARAPRVLYKSQVRVVNLEAPICDVFTWQDMVGLLGNPLSIMGIIQDGSILPSQVEAYKTCMPTLFNAILMAFENAVTNGLAAKKSFDIPPKLEFGLATLRGTPIDASIYQDAYVESDKPRQTEPTPSQAKSPLASESESAAQSAVYRQAGVKA